MFGDDIVKSEVPCARQLIDVYERYRPAGVVAVQEVPLEEISRYGVPKLKPISDPLAETGTNTEVRPYLELEHMVEKPLPAEAPSNLAQLGRFVLSYQIIRILEQLKTGKGGELWLTDAIDELAATESVIVHPIAGKWFTTGDPLRFLKTTVEFALDRPDIGPEFADYLRSLDLSAVHRLD
jgi:UTP--glucose-1-phosphate uridylyltransferase